MPRNRRKVYIASTGFDTKFQMRTLVNLGSGKIDTVIAVLPSKSDERAEKAVSDLRKFVESIMGIKFYRVGVEVDDIPASITRIYEAVMEHDPGEIYGDLSGGMRILVILLYTALSIINRIEAIPVHIVVWKEDLSRFLELPVGLDNVDLLDELEEKIIENTHTPRTLAELSKSIRRPKTTIYVRLQKMEVYGLVESKRIGKKVYYTSTLKGILAYGLTRARRKRVIT